MRPHDPPLTIAQAAAFFVAASFAATTPVMADPPSVGACLGNGCEFAAAPAASAPCAAAATNPDTVHQAFARGCIAQRDFSRRAPVRAEDCAAGDARCTASRGDAQGTALDPVRLPPVEVVGAPESDEVVPATLERRFAAQLNQGNPEVPGGKIRHGAFHALGVYWGADPLSFLYYNLRYGLGD